MSKSITEQLERIAKQFSDSLDAEAQKAVQDVAKNVARDLKATSPKGSEANSGRYAKGWTAQNVKAGRGVSHWVVRNRTDYQLTHLLEYGHAVVAWGVSTGKRTRAIPHIKPAEQKGIDELVRRLEKI